MKQFSWNDAQAVACIKQKLFDDQVIITSTDTILGFLGNVTKHSFETINKLKQRKPDNPYLVLIQNAQKLSHFIHVESLSPSIKNIIANAWPGPLTIIFNAKPGLPNFLVSTQETIALRCPDHAGLQQLLESFNGLFSTSANVSGAPAPKKIDDISERIRNAIQCVVLDDEQGSSHAPSTIIDISGKITVSKKVGDVGIVREGAYSLDTLKALL